MKIVSYNIHSGKNLWMLPQMHRLVRFLKQEKANIIGLQEINENDKRGLQVTKLKQELHMNVHFGGNIVIGDGEYGIANYTTYPIVGKKHILLTSSKEQRGLIDTKIKIDNKNLHILNTHLGLNKNERDQQIKEISNYVMTLKESFILMGDFNTTNPNLNEEIMIDCAKVSKKEHLPTMMLSNKRIDFIYISDDLTVLEYDVLQAKISDHYPVVLDVAFNN